MVKHGVQHIYLRPSQGKAHNRSTTIAGYIQRGRVKVPFYGSITNSQALYLFILIADVVMLQQILVPFVPWMINVPQWRSHLHFPYFFLSWMLTCWSENVSAKLQKIRLLLKNTRIAIDEFLQRTLACVVLIFFIAWVHNAHKSTTYRNLNSLIDSTYATAALIKTSCNTNEAWMQQSATSPHFYLHLLQH